MGLATFKTVAAGDGSPQSPSGYCYYLLIHAIATVLLLIALVAAAALDPTDRPCPHERRREKA
jgi:formate hydrogenlyase subunit 3/multisubunit Na+/H+ antiporter MnhD subunit